MKKMLSNDGPGLQTLSRLAPCTMESQIANFYKNKSVLITGVTGFLGKVLLEKLLRACPDLKCVFVLIREFRDKSPASRLAELLSSQAFDRLRHENPEALKKVVLIAGDMTKPGLSLSLEDKQLLSKEVSIVFNSAARLKFDEHLKEAIESNVKGPLELANISRSFTNLQVFVHISTAFCHFNEVMIDEIIPEADYKTLNLISRVEGMSDKEYNSLVKEVLSSYPNVYAYTKGIAEQLLARKYKTGFPLVVVKPSTIISSNSDPYPGWIDSFSGQNGLTAGIGKGLVQVCLAGSSILNDVVPVDFCANFTIAAAWSHITNKIDNLEVYNYCSGAGNPLTFGECIDWATESWRKNPLKDTLWYPSCAYYSHWLLYFFSVILNHYIPAVFIDLLSRLSGKKPFLMKLYKKIDKVVDVLAPYTLVNWNFKADNQIKLFEKMSPTDQKIFNFDTRNLDWRKITEMCCLGIRRYVFKEELSSIDNARKMVKRKKNVQLVFRILFYMFVAGCAICYLLLSQPERFSFHVA